MSKNNYGNNSVIIGHNSIIIHKNIQKRKIGYNMIGQASADGRSTPRAFRHGSAV